MSAIRNESCVHVPDMLYHIEAVLKCVCVCVCVQYLHTVTTIRVAIMYRFNSLEYAGEGQVVYIQYCHS